MNATVAVTVADALTAAQARLNPVSDSARLDAEWLLMHVTGWTRAQLLIRDTAVLDDAQYQRFAALIDRRAQGEPVAYLLGTQEFWGLPLTVTPDVLIPRADTETLVEWALDGVHPLRAPRIADLGTGSGAIALALAHARRDAQVWATDISAAALTVARANAARLQLPVQFAQGAWCAALPDDRSEGAFDLIVSNPPYIACDDAHLPALRFEPTLALTDGADGLSALQQIIACAPAHLKPGATLLLEHGHDQGAAVRARLTHAGFADVQTRRDYGGNERVTGGVWRTT